MSPDTNVFSSFEGKIVGFGEGFRQILLVISRSHFDIIHAIINASYLWDYCRVLTHKKIYVYNMMLLGETRANLVEQYKNEEFLLSRAILASIIKIVDQINKYVLSLITIKISYRPNYKIQLKVKNIIILRILDQYKRLCNETKLIVTRIANHFIEAKIMSKKNIGSLIYILHMFTSPFLLPWPFKLIRRQFPIIISYVMTINKFQGQLLASVRLYLHRPMFSHGKLYVAFSRIQSKYGSKILIHDKKGKALNTTTNLVFKEIFQNF
ncbi:hypothetical protein CR513_59879, partial [Mucuna pruriens]